MRHYTPLKKAYPIYGVAERAAKNDDMMDTGRILIIIETKKPRLSFSWFNTG